METMKRFLSYGSRAVLMMMVGVAALTTGCRMSDEEIAPVPQSADNPLDAAVYYVSGTLTDQDGAGVSGVEMSVGSANATTNDLGAYKITVSDKSALASGITFTMPAGYVGENKIPAVLPTSATKGATITVNHSIAEANDPIQISASGSTVYVDSDKVSATEITDAAKIAFASGALSDDTYVTITPFVPSASSTVLSGAADNGAITPAAGLNINLGTATLSSSIDVSVPEKSSSLVSRAAVSSSYYFKNMNGMIYKNSSWYASSATVTYSNSYYSFTVQSSDVSGLSSFSVGVTPELTVASNDTETDNLTTKVIDNFNYTDVVTETYTYNKYVGIVETGFTINGAASDNSVIKGEMKAYLETMLGAKVNTTAQTESVSDTAVVSGDTKVTVTYTQDTAVYTLTAEVTNDGTNSYDAVYTAKYYGVVNRDVETEQGNLRYHHNF